MSMTPHQIAEEIRRLEPVSKVEGFMQACRELLENESMSAEGYSDSAVLATIAEFFNLGVKNGVIVLLDDVGLITAKWLGGWEDVDGSDEGAPEEEGLDWE